MATENESDKMLEGKIKLDHSDNQQQDDNYEMRDPSAQLSDVYI